MYSFVFCRVFIVLVDFRLHCVTTVTPFIKRFLVRLVQDPCQIAMTSLDFVL